MTITQRKTAQICRRIRALVLPLVKQSGWRGAAAATGVPQMTLHRICNGQATPSAATLIALAKYFNASVDDLLGM